MNTFHNLCTTFVGIFCLGYMVLAPLSTVNMVILLGIGSILIHLGTKDG